MARDSPTGPRSLQPSTARGARSRRYDAAMSDTPRVLECGEAPAWIAGEPWRGADRLAVRYPATGVEVGAAALVGPAEVERAVAAALAFRATPTRFERYLVLERIRALLGERAAWFRDLILSETGLAACDAAAEVARAGEFLRHAAAEALRDDGRAFAGDAGPKPGNRTYTLREPLALAVAITPFNYPLNQVVHKVAPAIAAGTPLVLKPSEKTPLTALAFAELCYAAGLPGPLLSAFVGPVDAVVEPLVRDARVELVTFTGSVATAKRIASIAGYKRLCLELGGCSPLVVLDDADLELAARLAADECFRHSGQRCTAAKRLLVHERVLPELTERLLAHAAEFVVGDPTDPATRVGTLIDAAAAERVQAAVDAAVAAGARVLAGGRRAGAAFPPTVLADVPRDAALAREEVFGPVAPLFGVRDLDDAIALANATPYGLAATVVTEGLRAAMRCVREIRAGQVNVNAGPGYRPESAPFGGVKDSGLGVKEGVVEAVRLMTHEKTFSLPG
jgi:aldehyde dehydrogenase (NAD+)